MLRSLIRYSAVGFVVALVLGLSTGRVHSEIEITGTPKPAPAPARPAMTAEAPNASLRVQCWQNGVKILDEDNIEGIRLRNLIDRDSVGFRGRDSNGGEIHIIPFNDHSACLIKPMR
jgi:hypothetical protein